MTSTDHVDQSDQLDAGPGWKWDPATGTYVWWDGTSYRSRARWTGSSWAVHPLQSTPPPPAPARPRRWWLWGSLIVVGVVVVGLFGYGFHEACCTHDLLAADFESADGPFETGVRADFRADLHAGTYRITSTTPSPEGPAYSYAWLARPAGAMRAEVTVVDPGSGSVGVACLFSGGAGYGFVVEGGTARLVDLDGDRTLRRTAVEALQPGRRIGVRCGFGRLEGLIDGNVVMSSSYEPDGRYRFDRVVLSFGPAEQGDSARFDDVDVHLP